MSADNNNDGRRNFSKNPTWSNVVVILLFLATISGWFMRWGAAKETLKYMGKNLDDMTIRVRELEQWQKDWPLHGELIMDREQNSKLKELTGRLDRIENGAS